MTAKERFDNMDRMQRYADAIPIEMHKAYYYPRITDCITNVTAPHGIQMCKN